ncbi:MAG TPA: PIG-L family deacetylase, partial [Thermoleophilaceae bacterium]|nr:PIG-L family deacetylase [Thermoleophilaceae bacterium]
MVEGVVTSTIRRVVRRSRSEFARARTERADRRFNPRLAFHAEAPLVVLSPHPDDAVFNCWSVLTDGAPVRVVNVFAGVPTPGKVTWWDRICGATESAAQMRARLAEDLAVLEPLVGAPVNLPLLEEQYRDRGRIPLAAIDVRLVEAVGRASAVYAPAALGAGHIDHRLARALARALVPHGMPVWLYADLPYAARHGWPHWVTNQPPDPHLDVDRYWEPAFAQVPEMGASRDARVVSLPAEAASRKLDAMRAYATQFRGMDWGGLLSDPHTHGHELYWRLRAPSG